ncbi:hypothetical protein V5O48_008850 [Marasmius crinis-equi]|uniref:Nephrocystin 3-like N-terminal domain-containing protein n=1 Tax=Marasmius crinis-equi TaxID=585013 RepID=A0ABR3FCS6_9AGAR
MIEDKQGQGLQGLSDYVAFSANYNSEARQPHTGVFPGTRTSIIQTLSEWIKVPKQRSRVLWIRGAAGVGKSAIAQTLCEMFHLEHLVANFFFARLDPKRSSPERLVPSLAYQLAKSPALPPRLSTLIDNVVLSNPGIMHMKWEDQFERLIMNSCATINGDEWKKLPKLVIIDGLDECMAASGTTDDIVEGRRRLLTMIQQSTSAAPPLPLRFLIFSRPERSLRNFFHSQRFIPPIELLDMAQFVDDADIQWYLERQFLRLFESHPEAMKGLDRSWPGEDIIRMLVRRANGQFAYVVTVIGYITSEDSLPLLPQKRLEVVRHLREAPPNPYFGNLDRLYYQILEPFAKETEILRRILQLLLSPGEIWDGLDEMPPKDVAKWSQTLIARALGLELAEVCNTLSRLHSVLHVPDDDDDTRVSILHPSFSHFLLNHDRSGYFHIVPMEQAKYKAVIEALGPGPNVQNGPLVSVFQKLSSHVAFSALYDSELGGQQTDVHEGTRGDLIEKLDNWIEYPAGKSRVFWIRGGAGSGKSAVAQSICKKHAGSRLAASHFFSRNDSSRNSMDRFIPTLAYQLAELHGHRALLTSRINDALTNNPRIMDMSWEDQFKHLISMPCAAVNSELWIGLPRLVIIDGLDECMDRDPQTHEINRSPGKREGQQRLLSMIQNATSTQPSLPLRFLIFSRPEHAISTFFRSLLFNPALEQFDMRSLRTQADHDIELYLRHEFARLVELHPDAGLDKPWPGEEVIHTLILNADGQFIYIITAVKYIAGDDPYLLLPQQRLAVVLRTSETSLSPDLSPLDQLYHHILQPFMILCKQILLPIFQLIISPYQNAGHSGSTFSPDLGLQCRSQHAIAKLLALDLSQVSAILSRLHSILYVPDDEHRDVTILHASFLDFLTEERRSLHFYVAPLEGHVYFGMLSQCLLPTLNDMTRRHAAGERMPPGITNFELYSINVWLFIGVIFGVVVDSSYHGESLKEYIPSEELLRAMNEFDVYQYMNMLIDRDFMRDIYQVFPRLMERGAPRAMHVCTEVLFQNIRCLRALYMQCSEGTGTSSTSSRTPASPYATRFRSQLNPYINNHKSLFEEGWAVSTPRGTCTPNTLSQLALLILLVCNPPPSISAAYDEEFLNFLALPQDPRDADDNSESNTHRSFINFPSGTDTPGGSDVRVWNISCEEGRALVEEVRELGRNLRKNFDSVKKQEISPFTKTGRFPGLDGWNVRIAKLIVYLDSFRRSQGRQTR